MSGIEVAGLILGAFPLLLSGIEGYRKGYSKIGDWWTFQKKYKKFGNLVEVQHSVFRLNLRALLREVTYDDAELDRLMNDPRAAEWSSNDLARRLRDRLPSTHGVYVTTMRDMGLTLENLGEEMGFKNAGLQKWIAAEEVARHQQSQTGQAALDWREKIQSQTFRTKFSFMGQKRQELLEELRQGNESLRQLATEQPSYSRPLPGRRKAAMSPSLYKYWQHARDLYRLLQNASSCSCRASHRAHLALRQHHTKRGIEFEVLFTYAENITCQGPNAWDWKETKITWETRAQSESYSSSSPPTTAANVPSSNKPQTATVPRLSISAPGRHGQRQRRVAWADAIIDTALLPMRPMSPSPPISDLCKAIASLAPSCSCLGVLEQDSDRYFIQVSDQPTLPRAALEHITLQEILAKQKRLLDTRRQRYQIALSIASAYLQLHGSEWATAWNKGEIFFLFEPVKASLCNDPRISRDLVSSRQQEPLDHSIGVLGITLLEVFYGSVLEEYPMYQRNVPAAGPTVSSDVQTAKLWCVNHASNEDENFAYVIEWCLGKSPRRTVTDIELDRDWRRELYNNVVEPLTLCYKNNFQ